MEDLELGGATGPAVSAERTTGVADRAEHNRKGMGETPGTPRRRGNRRLARPPERRVFVGQPASPGPPGPTAWSVASAAPASSEPGVGPPT